MVVLYLLLPCSWKGSFVRGPTESTSTSATVVSRVTTAVILSGSATVVDVCVSPIGLQEGDYRRGS